MLRRTLTASGYTVLEAASTTEVLRLLISVVLTDLRLHGMDVLPATPTPTS